MKKNRKHTLTRVSSRIQRELERLENQLARLAQTRFLLFVLGFGVNTAVFLTQGAVVWGLIALPAFAPFIAAVALFNRQQATQQCWQRWLSIKQTHLARMTLDWSQMPPPYLPQSDLRDHPFALDFDLVGDRSLHQLLNTAVTQEGSARLLSWLLETTPEADVVNERQQRVAELTSMPLFRDKLTLHATVVLQKQGKFSGQRLLDWLTAQRPASDVLRPLLTLVALALTTLTLLVLSARLGNVWLIPWLLYLAIYARLSNRETGTLFQDATFLADHLETLDEVFAYLERARLEKRPYLAELMTPFRDFSQRPSAAIRRLRRVLVGVGIRQNPLIGLLLNIFIPWDLLFVYLLRRRQHELRNKLPHWLDVWYELEALSCLGTFAYLNPGQVTFPILAERETAVFSATQIAHPLIPDAVRVANDFSVDHLGQVTLITGSNMSGKSSFLRTVGLNLVLAYAGSPVLGEQMTAAYFRLYSSIRIADSLQDGYSFFYAEVRRLRAILDAAQAQNPRPLFFFIDEIFRGTNNRERLIGSRAYIEAMVGGTAVGLVATHDLELVQLAESSSSIVNAHFRDDVSDGQMVFDYLLRPGPSPTTNALKIMKLAGLPVPPPNKQRNDAP